MINGNASEKEFTIIMLDLCIPNRTVDIDYATEGLNKFNTRRVVFVPERSAYLAEYLSEAKRVVLFASLF